jgi:hypothetical protein
MKIYSSKVDDLRRERDEWDTRYKESEARYREQKSVFRQATHAVCQAITDPIMSALSKFDLLEFKIATEPTSVTGRESGIEVIICCNEDRLHDKTSALVWSFRVKLGKEGVEAQTGSWSGLKAATPESLASLKQTVEALEYLNSMDWEALLDKELPNWDDYVTEEVDRNRPNFEQQIKEAELQDFIGADDALLGKSPYAGNNPDFWYVILRETPKKYEVITMNAPSVEDFGRFLDFSLEQKLDYIRTSDLWSHQIMLKKEDLLNLLYFPLKTLSESLK